MRRVDKSSFFARYSHHCSIPICSAVSEGGSPSFTPRALRRGAAGDPAASGVKQMLPQRQIVVVGRPEIVSREVV